MHLLHRFVLLALATFSVACGEAVVGRSPYANTPPLVDPIADVTTPEDVAVTVPVTMTDAEDVDVLVLSAASDNPALIDATGFAFGGSGGSRTFTLTPKPNQFGTATITLTVTDSDSFVPTVERMFVLTVTPVNDPPVLTGLGDVTIDEDGVVSPQAFTVADVDHDVATVAVTVAIDDTTLLPDAGLVRVSSTDLTWGGAPVADGFGPVTLTFRADDGVDASTVVVTLTVRPVNDAPTLAPIADVTVDEDLVSAPVPLALGDVDDLADTLTLRAVSSDPSVVPNDRVVFAGTGANRTLTVQSAPDRFGTTTITVTVTDAAGLEASQSFLVTVLPVNDAPVISVIADVAIDEDTSAGPLLFTVDDVDDAATTLVVTGASADVALVTDAALQLGGTARDRTLAFTPVLQANGTTTITLTVTDPTGATDTSTFTVVIASVNDLPTLAVPADQATDEDVPLLGLALTIGDVETAATALVVTVASSNPSLVDAAGLVLGGAGTNRTLDVLPRADQFGTTTLTVTVDDGTDSVSLTFDVVVRPVNDAPTITAVADRTVDEDSVLETFTFTVDDVDDPVASLLVTSSSSNPALVADPSGLTLVGTAPTYTLEVRPTPQANGTTQLTLTVSDGQLSTLETVTFTVVPRNDPPTLAGFTDVSTPEDTPLVVPFTYGDIDTALTSVTITATSSDGTVLPDARITVAAAGGSGTLTLSPAADAFGTTTITVVADDGLEQTTVTFVLTVTPVNDAPVISAVGPQTIDEDGTTGPLVFTVLDVDDAPADVLVSASGDAPTLVGASGLVLGGTNPNRTVTVTPTADANGAVTVTLTADDGSATTTRTFLVTVRAVNDPTVITGLADLVLSEDTPSGALAFTLADVDDDVCTLNPTLTSTNPAVASGSGAVFGGSCANRTLTLTPTADGAGTADLAVRVVDGSGPVDAPFTLTVTPVEDAPRLTGVVDATIAEDGTYVVTVGVFDPDLPAQPLVLTGSSDTDALVPDANVLVAGAGATRTVTVTPVAEGSGVATIRLVLGDGVGTTTATFDLTVTAVDDAPIITLVTTTSFDEDASPVVVGFTVTDPDSTPAVTAAASDTTLFPVGTGLVVAGAEPNFTLTLDSAPDAAGTATVTVTADDGTNVVTATLTVTVNPVNDPPSLGPIANAVVLEDTDTGGITLVLSDTETPCAALVLTATTDDATLLPTGNVTFGGTCPNRTVTLSPAANQFGSVLVTVTVTDAGGLSATQSFTLDVTSVLDDPIVQPDLLTTQANITLVDAPLAGNDSDPEGGTLSFSLPSATSARGGELSLDPVTGEVTYTPPPGYVGVDTFDYEATAGGPNVTATVTVNVTGPVVWFVDNSAPTSGANGTDAHPFPTLAALDAEPLYLAGHQVRVDYGDGTRTGYDAGFTLKAGCTMVGIPGGVAGTTPPQLGRVAGSSLTLTGSGSVTGIDFAACATAITATAITGTVTLTDVGVSGCASGLDAAGTTAAAALVLDGFVVDGASTLGARVSNLDVTFRGTNRGVELHATGGTGLRLQNGSTVVAGSTIAVLELTGSTCVAGLSMTNDVTGSLTFGTVDVQATGACNGASIAGATVDLGVGSFLEVGSGSALVATSGVRGDLNRVACGASTVSCVDLAGTGGFGTLQVDDLDANTTGAPAVLLLDAGDVDVSTGTVQAVGAAAIDMELCSGDVNLASVVADGTSQTLIRRVDCTGSLVVDGSAPSTLSSTTGVTVLLDEAATVTLRQATLTSTSADTIRILGRGAVTLEGSVVDGPSSAGDACIWMNVSAVSLSVVDSRLHSATRLIDLRGSSATGQVATVEVIGSVLENGASDCLYFEASASQGLDVSLAAGTTRTVVRGCGVGVNDADIEWVDTSDAPVSLAMTGVDFTAGRSALVGGLAGGGPDSLTIDDVTIVGADVDAVRWHASGCNARSEVTVLNSSIGDAATSGSGSVAGDGIDLQVVSATGACVVPHRIEQLRVAAVAETAVGAAGLRLSYDLDAGVASAVRVLNNTLDLNQGSLAPVGTGFAFESTNNARGACFAIRDNTVGAAPGVDVTAASRGGAGASVLESFASTVAATLSGVNTIANGSVTESAAGTFVAGTCPAL